MKLLYSFVLICIIPQTFCEYLHHIEGRNLENNLKENGDNNTDKDTDSLAINITTTLDLGSSSTSLANLISHLPISVETSTKFNVSSLLRGQPQPIKNVTEFENGNHTNGSNNNSLNITNYLKHTEVPSLLNSPIRANLHQYPLENHSPVDISDNINDETELIENGQNTEDELRKHSNMLSDDILPQQRYLAVIVACTLTGIAIICYVSLWSWRRYLERRYGSRTMLVNAEEFDDPNDIHHFTI